jgi:AhpD family alkylhydroperoxidase
MSSIARISLDTEASTELTDVWRALPGLGTAVSELAARVYDYDASTLTARERECARMRIAQINNCKVCLGWRIPSLAEKGVDEELYAHVSEYRDCDLYSPREKLAIEYTERFMLDHRNMGDEFWARMKAHFSEREILDLGITVGHLMAFGRLTAVLQLGYAACALDRLTD